MVLRINLAITLIIAPSSLVVGGSIWSAIAGVVVPFVIQFTIVTLDLHRGWSGAGCATRTAGTRER